MMRDYEELYGVLGYRFNDKNLLMEALTHNSAKNNKNKKKNYQRLEFLGDRVLGLVIASMLYNHFRGEAEGDLAKRHTALVREETLAEVACKIKINEYLIVSKKDKDEVNNPSILADVCEALIGALYVEAGFAKAKEFIEKYWSGMMLRQVKPPVDAKSMLQEWAQAKGHGLPEYRVAEVKGADHNPEFVIEVKIDGIDKAGTGKGGSKKVAEQNAAKILLEEIKKDG